MTRSLARALSVRLILAAALLSLASAGTTLAQGTSASVPTASVPRAGSVVDIAFWSQMLGITKHARVYLPPSYASSDKR